MTLIEKAGAALYERWTRQPDFVREAAMNGPHPAWERLEEGTRAKWCGDARAVLEAIREPSATVALAMARAIEASMPCDSGEDPPQAEVMVDYGVSNDAAAAMVDAIAAELPA